MRPDEILCRALDEGGQAFAWCRERDGLFVTGEGSGDDLREAAAGLRVILLVDTVHVGLFDVAVPARNPAQLAQALPYALEEALAQDLAELRIVPGARSAQGRHAAAAVAREWFDRQVGMLGTHGVPPQAIVPDVFGLPWETDGATMLIDGPRALVRSGAQAGFVMQVDALTDELATRPADRGEPPPARWAIHVSAGDGERAAALAGRLPDAFVQVLDPDLSPLEFAARHLDTRHALDLLWSRERRATDGITIRWQMLAAAVLLAALVAQVGLQFHRLQRTERAVALQVARSEAEFRTLFPDVRRLVDVRAQTRGEIAALARIPDAGIAFLDGLHLAGDVLRAQASGLTLTTLAYDGRTLLLSVAAPSMERVEAYRRSLGEQAVAVELLSAENQDERVVARLRLAAL